MRGPGSRIAAATAIVAALLLRLMELAHRPLWYDEIYTLWLGRRSLAGIAGALRSDSGPPLFYWLEKPFVALAQLAGDPFARLLPFLCIAALFSLARRAGRRVSAAAILLAASPLLFFYSGEARAYALLTLESFALFTAVWRVRRSPRSLAAVFACGAALPWTHYLGVFVVVSSVSLALVRRRRREAAAILLGACTFTLWLPTALAQPKAAIAWSAESFTASIAGFFSAYGGWGRYPPYFFSKALPFPAVGMIAGFLLLLSAAAAARRDAGVRVALAFALLPILLAAAASAVTPIYFTGRTEMATLPVAIWAASRAARRSRTARAAAALVALLGGATILTALSHAPAAPPYADVARFVGQRARASDAVIAADADYLPIRLASERAGGYAVTAVPSQLAAHPGWFDIGPLQNAPREAALLRQAAGRALASTLWIAFPPDPRLPPLIAPLLSARGYRVHRFPAGDLVLEISSGRRRPAAAGGDPQQEKAGER